MLGAFHDPHYEHNSDRMIKKRFVKTVILAACCCTFFAASTPSAMADEDNNTAPTIETLAEQIVSEINEADFAPVVEPQEVKSQTPAQIFQHGNATFYGKSWHGRKTSSGERLNNEEYQCAHRTLPFGTLVKVTNKKNGKSCIVKVVDRGPFGKGMVIDLTYEAARSIGMLSAGVVPVSLEKIEPGTPIVKGQIVSSKDMIVASAD